MIMSRQRIIEWSKNKNISYLRDPKMTEYISDGVIVALKPDICEDVARIIWKHSMEYKKVKFKDIHNELIKKVKFKDIHDEFISALQEYRVRNPLKYRVDRYICTCKKSCICIFSKRLKSFYMKDIPPHLHWKYPTASYLY